MKRNDDLQIHMFINNKIIPWKCFIEMISFSYYNTSVNGIAIISLFRADPSIIQLSFSKLFSSNQSEYFKK